MRSVEYLKELQVKKGLNAAGLAKLLNVTEGGMSHYFKGKRVMDDETCLAVALELGVDPMQVIGAACIDRAEKTGQKSLWEVFMSRTAATTAAAVLVASGVNLFLTTSRSEAATMRVPEAAIAGNIDYAKLGGRRRKRDASRKNAVRTWFEGMLLHRALKPAAS